MSVCAGVVFKTSEEVDFVAELAGWISPPPQPEGGEGEGQEAPLLEPSEFQTECNALKSQKEFEKLATKLTAAIKERFSAEPEADVECAYAVLLQLLLQWGLLQPRLLALADEFSGSAEDRPLLRRTLLISLYALVQQYSYTELRFPMLLRLLSYCAATGSLDAMLGGPAKRCATVEKWIRELDLSAAQKKELWGLIVDSFLEDSAATHVLALKYLPLHAAEEVASDAKLKERLVQSLLVTIRSREMPNCDKLAQLAVVNQLRSDKEYAPLLRLLDALAREKYKGYLALYEDKAVQAFMAAHALEHSACQRKMRLLTLVTLGLNETTKELPYADIAEELQIEPTEVETWVMEAIRCGLIMAKMDQVRELVVVSGCTEREFHEEQWDRLKVSLGQWGESVKNLLSVVSPA